MQVFCFDTNYLIGFSGGGGTSFGAGGPGASSGIFKGGSSVGISGLSGTFGSCTSGVLPGGGISCGISGFSFGILILIFL